MGGLSVLDREQFNTNINHYIGGLRVGLGPLRMARSPNSAHPFPSQLARLP